MEYTTIDITQSDIDKSLSQRIGFYLQSHKKTTIALASWMNCDI